MKVLLRKMAAVIPDDRNVYFNLGAVLMNLQRRQEANMAFDEAFTLQPGGKTREAYFDPHGC